MFYFCYYCCFVMLGKLFHLLKHSIKKKYESLLIEPCLNDSELFRNHSSKWSQFFYMIFSSVQLLSRVQLLVTPWTAARQASLSITNSRSSPKPMSIESVMPSSHLILCHPLLLLPSIFPSIRVFSNELALHIRWPKYWSYMILSWLYLKCTFHSSIR